LVEVDSLVNAVQNIDDIVHNICNKKWEDEVLKNTKRYIVRECTTMMRKNNILNVDTVLSDLDADKEWEESVPIPLDRYSMDRTALRKQVIDLSVKSGTPLRRRKKKKDMTSIVKRGFIDAVTGHRHSPCKPVRAVQDYCQS